MRLASPRLLKQQTILPGMLQFPCDSKQGTPIQILSLPFSKVGKITSYIPSLQTRWPNVLVSPVHTTQARKVSSFPEPQPSDF